MARIEVDSKAVQAALRAKAVQARKEGAPVVVVGYTAAYAIYQHEDLTMTVAGGATLAQGLMLAGLRLQRESQLLCPVDTGHLRSSAFTRLER
jgi:CRISPR/Cas system-associated exonuclease Cas4 (RecB family)